MPQQTVSERVRRALENAANENQIEISTAPDIMLERLKEELGTCTIIIGGETNSKDGIKSRQCKKIANDFEAELGVPVTCKFNGHPC